jgi:hypothetical protein
MPRLMTDRMQHVRNRKRSRRWPRRPGKRGLLLGTTSILTISILTMLLAACSGKNTSSVSQPDAALQGNWQFTMAPQTDGNPGDPAFSGGLLGGFLLETDGSITGQTVYSVTSSTAVPGIGACNSGSAPVNVTLNGQNVTIAETAGTQTFTLTGTLSSNGLQMTGTYQSTAGTAADGSVCGYAVTGLSWSAVLVPPLTGSIAGSFHSGGTGDNSGLLDQEFVVTGSLVQGANLGASNATVTGMLSFIDPTTGQSDYPCIPLGTVSVNGQISGNTVILQLIDVNGSTDGQIGIPLSQATSNGLNVVTFDSTTNGYVLHSTGQAYVVNTKSCPSTAGGNFEDLGSVCLALNGGTTCQQPITLSPAILDFPPQLLGTPATLQTITLTNSSGSLLSGLTLQFSDNNTYLFSGESDFNNLPSFAETDTCGSGGGPSQQQPFNLNSSQSCSITITFSPQEGCPWLPFGTPPTTAGAPPEWCPLPFQGLQLAVTSPISADNNPTFVVPVTGIGLSAIQPATHELDFSAEEQFNPPEASVPQTLSFTNVSANPVQILGAGPCVNPSKGPLTLPAPRQQQAVAGLLVVGTQPGVNNGILPVVPIGTAPPTITYNCDTDPGTSQPNFQLSSDTCTGTLLASQQGCSVQITYIPQPNTALTGGADYFLELNTLQCWPAGTVASGSNPCEVDSGRFPVELRANPASPLRMSPSAGLDFGNQAVETKSATMTITLLNDPRLTNPQTVTFVGRILASGNYSESDDCPASLAPGSSCTLSVTFKPASAGFIPGTLTINYTPEPTSAPQIVRLRGTGQ